LHLKVPKITLYMTDLTANINGNQNYR